MNDFDLKKLLKCIMFSVLVTCFIGFTNVFISKVMMNSYVTAWNELDNNPQYIEYTKNRTDIGYESYNYFLTEANELKEKYGDDYPAEEVLFYRIMMLSNTEDELSIYLAAIIFGIGIGTIVYIISEQKAKGKVLIIELLVSALGIMILLIGIDFGHTVIVNSFIKSSGFTGSFKSENINETIKFLILIGFVILSISLYLSNLIIQKINSKKLNEELNKK